MPAGAPKKEPEECCSESIRISIKSATYQRLLRYQNDLKYPTLSFAARRVIELVDSFEDSGRIEEILMSTRKSAV